jgi:hypothetical protein
VEADLSPCPSLTVARETDRRCNAACSRGGWPKTGCAANGSRGDSSPGRRLRGRDWLERHPRQFDDAAAPAFVAESNEDDTIEGTITVRPLAQNMASVHTPPLRPF